MPDRAGLRVDTSSGAVVLPHGDVITPDLTLEAFETSGLEEAGPRRAGGTGYVTVTVAGGAIDEHLELLVQLQFRDMQLTSLMLDATRVGRSRGWSDWSMEGEAERKGIHDRLLRVALGDPHEVRHFPPRSFAQQDTALGESLVWNFPWGRAASFYDAKGGFATTHIVYG